jgi:hypothetical protein
LQHVRGVTLDSFAGSHDTENPPFDFGDTALFIGQVRSEEPAQRIAAVWILLRSEILHRKMGGANPAESKKEIPVIMFVPGSVSDRLRTVRQGGCNAQSKWRQVNSKEDSSAD